MTEEDIKYYQDYRNSLQDVVDKSENEFEKRLLYIAAGALGLSFSFITDIVTILQSVHLWLLITGWVEFLTLPAEKVKQKKTNLAG